MEAPNNKQVLLCQCCWDGPLSLIDGFVQLKDLWPHFTALHSSSSDHDYDTWAQFMMSLVHTGFGN